MSPGWSWRTIRSNPEPQPSLRKHRKLCDPELCRAVGMRTSWIDTASLRSFAAFVFRFLPQVQLNPPPYQDSCRLVFIRAKKCLEFSFPPCSAPHSPPPLCYLCCLLLKILSVFSYVAPPVVNSHVTLRSMYVHRSCNR